VSSAISAYIIHPPFSSPFSVVTDRLLLDVAYNDDALASTRRYSPFSVTYFSFCS
jgi:hypothetical protein